MVLSSFFSRPNVTDNELEEYAPTEDTSTLLLKNHPIISGIDIIHNYGERMPLSNLIASLPIHPSKTHFIYRLMRIKIQSAFFSQQNDTGNELKVKYALTDASILLLKSHVMSVTPFLHVMLDPILMHPWNHFSAG
ncbi:hypothetical protein Fmac_031279 [Flemingia macrophylla]|uniref:Maturase K n=1 Tax=Flemingia macrophylla TaxID=520843 RepID=A0ABD1L216_9FABA